MVDFHWKNEANRWRSEICLIRSYADSLLIFNCLLVILLNLRFSIVVVCLFRTKFFGLIINNKLSTRGCHLSSRTFWSWSKKPAAEHKEINTQGYQKRTLQHVRQNHYLTRKTSVSVKLISSRVSNSCQLYFVW